MRVDLSVVVPYICMLLFRFLLNFIELREQEKILEFERSGGIGPRN